jgi:hypothetical protein
MDASCTAQALMQGAVGNDEGHRPEDILGFSSPNNQQISWKMHARA